jgi:ABC-type lipoprotein export system ATPase subunit
MILSVFLLFRKCYNVPKQKGVEWMLRLQNVSKYYHTGNHVVLALKDINLDLRIGEFVVITGESGSGKSTLLNVLSGLDTYEDGKVLVNGIDLTYYTVDELERYRRDYIGFIFQDYNIIDSYSVYQNVELALTVQGLPPQERKAKVIDIIERVGLKQVMHQKAAKLSGGEKQRTVIARTLAKDSKIIVCDEPTGNLDGDSGLQILQLLQSISEDKLVIVVTHDYEAIESFATRKIRLYDGEILEDVFLHEQPLEAITEIEDKNFRTSFIDKLKIARNNTLTVPKKSFFIFLILTFLIAVSFFTYSNGVAEQNRPYSFTSPYFVNPDQSRIVITKQDESRFTIEEMDDIQAIEYVRSVFNNDVVFDTELLNATVDPVYGLDTYYYFRILHADALNEFDLIEGTLPTKANEVVISDRTFYQVGDYISLEDTYLTQKVSGMQTDQFTYKIVGITNHNVRIEDDLHTIYITEDGLLEVAKSSLYARSETYVEVVGTTTYFTPNEQWITPDIDPTVPIRTSEFSLFDKIRIDNELDNYVFQVYDMLFYNICREFGYKKEIVDDMDAGLCNADDFLASHSFQMSAVTTFQNTQEFTPITFDSLSYVENGNDRTLYMNEYTYNHFFGESSYQITAIVYDVYEGKQVIETLEEMGYNVFYPSQIIGADQGTTVLMTNIRILLVILFTLTGVFLVGYLVLKNVIMSKQRDYLILRSLGTSKRVIRQIIQLEVLYVFLLSSIVVVVGLIVLEQFNTQVPPVLRYIQFIDYVIIFTAVILVLQLMIQGFGRKVFHVNLIATLKGLES